MTEYEKLCAELKELYKTDQVRRIKQIVELLKKIESEQGTSTGNCISGNYKNDLLK